MPAMRRINCNIYLTTVYQVAIAFLLLWLTRLGFYYYNRELIDPTSSSHLWRLMSNGVPFDASATVYFNALFLLMRFLPWKFVLRRGYIMASDVIYYVTNSIMLLLNVADIPFFAFQGSRMRFSSLCDTFTDPNIAGIMLSYAVEYWWAYLGSIALIALMVWLIPPPQARLAAHPAEPVGHLRHPHRTVSAHGTGGIPAHARHL